MKQADIRSFAKRLGVSPVGKKKETLVREIQRAEKNRDCYNRGESITCGQVSCTWREDCK